MKSYFLVVKLIFFERAQTVQGRFEIHKCIKLFVHWKIKRNIFQ